MEFFLQAQLRFVLAITMLRYVLTIALSARGHQSSSRCVQMFDQGIRHCCRDMSGVEVDIVYSLVTNETSGRLPPNLALQKQKLITTLCGNRQRVSNCMKPLVTNTPTCQQTDIGMMDGTVNSVISGLGNLCGVRKTIPIQVQQPSSKCAQNFDETFRKCFQENGNIDFNIVYSLITTNTSNALPADIAKQKQNTTTTLCGNRQELSNCIKFLITNAVTTCQQADIERRNDTVTSMISGLGNICGRVLGKTIPIQVQKPSSKCAQNFDETFRKCFQENGNIDFNIVYSLITTNTSEALPADIATQKQNTPTTLCGNRQGLSNCIKSLITNAVTTCQQADIGRINDTVTSVISGLGNICGSGKTIPIQVQQPSSKCAQNFDKTFRKCFQENGNIDFNIVYSLITTNTSNELPSDKAKQKQNTTTTLCGNRQEISNCIKSLMTNAVTTCQQADIERINDTVTSVMGGFGNLCGSDLTVAVRTHGQTPPLRCMQIFDQGFRRCCQDMEGMQSDFLSAFVTIKPNGLLPQNLEAQHQHMIPKLCRNRQRVSSCVKLLVSNAGSTCQQVDIEKMNDRLTSMMNSLNNLCGTG